jgi:chromosomal replication initiation ATPase DnaA
MEHDGVLSQFSMDRRRAERKYIKYMMKANKGKTENPLKEVYGRVILGGEEFAEKIKEMLKGKGLSQEIIARKKLTEHPAIEEVIEAVGMVCGVNKGTILDKGGKENRARKMALYLAQRYSGLSNEEIGVQFSGIHYSAVSKAAARVKKEMASDKDLLKLVNELISRFKA